MTAALVLLVALAGGQTDPASPPLTVGPAPADSVLEARLARYATARLEADLSGLDDSTRAALAHLVAAAQAVDNVFWTQVYGPRDSVLAQMPTEAARRYAAVNYGPYSRLDGGASFVPDVGPRPPGANLYPAGLDRDALYRTADLYPRRRLTSPYTLVRRDGDGRLVGVPYRTAFAEAHGRAAAHLRRAAAFTPDSALAQALRLRAGALLTDEYGAADRAWARLRDNAVDVVVGPVETFEDGLAGVKAAHGAVVLVRDRAWDARLRRWAALLPDLRAALGVEAVGPAASLGVYDAALLAGEANAGPKPVALDLPNSPAVRAEAGARRLLLRNVARAKHDRVFAPIADLVLAPDQRGLATFEAAFGHAALHVFAHVLTGAPEGGADALAEATADALALWLVGALAARGAWDGAAPEAHAAAFAASAVRTARLGAEGPRGRGALVVLGALREAGAVVPESTEDGEVWRVVPDTLGPAVDALVRDLLGDADAAARLVRQRGRVGPALARALRRVEAAGVPVDVVLEQGPGVLGLEPAPPLPPGRRP